LPEREADHSFPSISKANNAWTYTSIRHMLIVVFYFQPISPIEEVPEPDTDRLP
jgi:hypothetical protein